MSSFNLSTTGAEVVAAFPDSLAGKTILITGASENGIGAQTAIDLASGSPKLIVLAGRTKSKVQPVLDTITKNHPQVAVNFLELDLSSQVSVRDAARDFNASVEKLDILINNAGVMAIKNYTPSKEGIEMQFAVNHLGHFLLTNLLMPKIIAAGSGARIVNVSSWGHLAAGVRFEDWNFKKGAEYNSWLAYSQSKTANILFASALARKLGEKGVLAFSLNPGLVLETKLQDNVTQEQFQEGFKVTMEGLNGDTIPVEISPIPLAVGSATSCFAALEPRLQSNSGAFLDKCAVYTGKMREHTVGEEKEEGLWELSERLVGEKFEYN